MMGKYLFILLTLLTLDAVASGTSIGKIENPYVQQLERELEYELVSYDDADRQFAKQHRHKLAYGQSISDRLFLEAGISALDVAGQNLEISSYEIEAKYQISEQGEFNNDWGVLFEIEREESINVWEFATTLIVLREWKRWVGTANLTLAYETGRSIDDEIETELAMQLRYRRNAFFEPGIEFYKSESTNSAGPSISGRLRLGGGKKLFWSAATLFTFDSSKQDNTLRFSIEYEF